MDRSIRRRTREEQQAERYAELYAVDEDRRRAEWEAEFGANNPVFPFKSDGLAIHSAVTAQMNQK